jgi:hypothetical protein
VCSGDGLVAYLVLGLLEIEQDEIVVGEVCVGEHEADTIGGGGGYIAVERELWHVGERQVFRVGVIVQEE